MKLAILHFRQLLTVAFVLFAINAQYSELHAADKPTEVNGVISALDAPARTILVQVGTDTKEFEFGRKTKISVNGKDASVDQMRIGQTVLLLVDEGLGVAVSIQAKQGDAKSVTVEGAIVSVDAAARLIRIATKTSKEREFEVSRRAKITIAGKEATVGDLTVDQVVTLDMVPGLEVATAITADAVGNEAKAAPKSKALLRVIMAMSTSGQGNLVLGRPGQVPIPEPEGKPAKLLFLPNATSVLQDDGSYAINYDFRKTKAIDELVTDEAGEQRLDKQLGVLLLIPKERTKGKGHFTAGCSLKVTTALPIVMSFDIDNMDRKGLLNLSVTHRTRTDAFVCNVFTFKSLDGLKSKVQISAISVKREFSTENNQPPRLINDQPPRQVIAEQVVSLSAPQEISFTIPAERVSADDRCSVMVATEGLVALSISRWSLTASICPDFGLQFGPEKQNHGVVVKRVVAKSIAAKAGIKAGDRLLSVDGVGVFDGSAATMKLAETQIGETCVLMLSRSGKETALRLKAE